MSKKLSIDELVPSSLEGERLDRALCLLADLTRSQVQTLIEESKVKLDGVSADKGSTKLKTGSRLEAEIQLSSNKLEADKSVDVEVLYVDDSIIILNKHADQVVHPGAGNNNKTLVNGLLYQFPEISDIGEKYRPGIIHRLDKETSGLLVVARNKKAYSSLKNQIESREVVRLYKALVVGDIANKFGEIDAPLGRSLKDPRKRAVVADGKWARTNFEVVSRYENPISTLLDCSLDTGRTHQIRVHLSSIGHPIYGDNKYGADVVSGFNRIFLHAYQLEFLHPDTHEVVSFHCELPADLTNILDTMDKVDVA